MSRFSALDVHAKQRVCLEELSRGVTLLASLPEGQQEEPLEQAQLTFVTSSQQVCSQIRSCTSSGCTLLTQLIVYFGQVQQVNFIAVLQASEDSVAASIHQGQSAGACRRPHAKLFIFVPIGAGCSKGVFLSVLL